MDPVTAILNAYAATLTAWATFYNGASPEQKIELVQQYIDDRKFWRDLFSRFKIGT